VNVATQTIVGEGACALLVAQLCNRNADACWSGSEASLREWGVVLLGAVQKVSGFADTACSTRPVRVGRIHMLQFSHGSVSNG
jgi:hypothetical protein